ncbi:MAG: phage tail protein [Planctomycetes bacterium]|nr:phage tail protein [Planctomycetota bacterium]
MATGKRKIPYQAYRFIVEVDGIALAEFFSATGLHTETEVLEFQEGGENQKVHKLVGQTKYTNIVLKRGVTESMDLWKWRQEVVQNAGGIQRKNGSVIMTEQNGDEVYRWNFVRGWPCKWEGPEFDANADGLAIEALEIAHEGIEMVKGGGQSNG